MHNIKPPVTLRFEDIQINDHVFVYQRLNEIPEEPEASAEKEWSPYEDSYSQLDHTKVKQRVFVQQQAFEPNGVPGFVVGKNYPFIFVRSAHNPCAISTIDMSRYSVIGCTKEIFEMFKVNNFPDWLAFQKHIFNMGQYCFQIETNQQLGNTVFNQKCKCGFPLSIGLDNKNQTVLLCNECRLIVGHFNYVKYE